MSLKFMCEVCKKSYEVKDELAGKVAKCSQCGHRIHVPRSAEDLSDSSDLSSLFDEALPTSHTSNAGMVPPSGPMMSQTYSDATSKPRWTKKRSIISRPVIAKGGAIMLLILICVTCIAIAVWAIRSGHQSMKERQQISELITFDAMKKEPTDADVAQLAECLPSLLEVASELNDNNEKQAKQRRRLGQLVSRLPASADISYILDVEREHFLYQPVFTALQRHKSVNWLIQRSCQEERAVRLICADVLCTTFPFGRSTPADLAKMAEMTNVQEKQQSYDEVYERIHQELERELCGNYRIRIQSEFAQAEDRSVSTNFLTTNPCLTVSCADRVWTIEFLGIRWTGNVAELSTVSLSHEFDEAINFFDGLEVSAAFLGAQFRLSTSQDALQVNLSNVQMYVPVQRFGPIKYSRQGGRITQDVEIPRGAVNREAFFEPDGSRVVYYYTPFIPGFKMCQAALEKVGSGGR